MEKILNFDKNKILVNPNYLKSRSRNRATNEEQIEQNGSDAELESQRDLWIEFLGNSNQHSHFLTVSFRKAYTDAIAMEALRKLSRMMNRRTKGPRWKKKGDGLSGVVFAERHKISATHRGILHFHVLLSKDSLPGDESRIEREFYRCCFTLRDKEGHQMIDKSRVNIQTVYQQPVLLRYLTKDFASEGLIGDSIAFWDRSTGVTGLVCEERSYSDKLANH